MNIIKRELRHNLKALLIWITVLVFIVFTASAEFGAFKDNEALIEAMESFNDMFKAMGMEVTDISTPEGFVALFSIYFYIPLSIYAALLGSSIISKEERDKTAEYLFTLPVTRRKVLTSKLIATIFYNIVLNVVLMLGIIVIFLRFYPTAAFFEFLLYLSIGLMFTQLIFMSIGMFLSALLKQYKRSGSISLGILLGSYLLSILVGLSSKIDFLKYLTPFKYFEVTQMLESNIELKFVIISLVIVSSCITGLFIFYEKRDLYI